jgi:hypothetical protein
MISTNFERIDTIPTFTINWKNNVPAIQRNAGILPKCKPG